MTKDPILDPVAAAVSCIYCADLLKFLEAEPTGVYLETKQGLSLHWDYHVSKIMHQACIWAYPNPAHQP
jgi:hypothetical protein